MAAFVGQPVWAAAAGAGLALVYWALEVLTWRRARDRPTSPSASRWAAWACGSSSSSAGLVVVGVLAGRRSPRRRSRSSPPSRSTSLSASSRTPRRPRRRGKRGCSEDTPGAGSSACWSSASSSASRSSPAATKQEFEVAERVRPRGLIKLPTIGPFDLSVTKAVIYLWHRRRRHRRRARSSSRAVLKVTAGPLPVRHGGALRAGPRRHRRLGHEERQGDVVPLHRRRLLLRPRHQPHRPAAAALRRAPPAGLLRRHGQPQRHASRWRCSRSCSRTTPASARTAPSGTSRTGRRPARRRCSSR